MFDNIQFLPFQFHFPLKSEYYDRILDSLDAQNASEQLLENVEEAFHSQFYLSGESLFLPVRPISAFASKNLFYLQIFCLLYSRQGYYTKRSDYNSYMLLYTYEGEGILEYENETYHLKAGEGFFIDCRKPHHYYTKSLTWYHSDLHIHGSYIDDIYQEYIKKGVLFYEPPNGAYQQHLETLISSYQELSTYWEYEVCIHIEHLLLYLLKERNKCHGNAAMPDTIRQLIRHLETNYSQSLSLDDLAHFSGISKYHLSREFKRHTGFSPNDYLIELRIRQAETLLKTTDLPAVKIGYVVGFKTENNFVTLFKKKVGCTPAQYRKGINITN